MTRHSLASCRRSLTWKMLQGRLPVMTCHLGLLRPRQGRSQRYPHSRLWPWLCSAMALALERKSRLAFMAGVEGAVAEVEVVAGGTDHRHF